MSTTAVVPPPNSSLPERRVPRLTARARALMTAMNLHFAGVAVLLLLDLYLIVHLIFVWQGLSANSADAIDQPPQGGVRRAQVAQGPGGVHI